MTGALREEQLLGAWVLQDWEILYSDGRAPTLPFGEGATGLLLYAAGGYMSAGISRAGRRGFGGASVRHAGAGERAAAFDSHFHYQGRFRIAGDCVEHHVTESLNPDFVGTVQVRRARPGDGTLELSAEDTLPSGVRRTHLLRWARAG